MQTFKDVQTAIVLWSELNKRLLTVSAISTVRCSLPSGAQRHSSHPICSATTIAISLSIKIQVKLICICLFIQLICICQRRQVFVMGTKQFCVDCCLINYSQNILGKHLPWEILLKSMEIKHNQISLFTQFGKIQMRTPLPVCCVKFWEFRNLSWK